MSDNNDMIGHPSHHGSGVSEEQLSLMIQLATRAVDEVTNHISRSGATESAYPAYPLLTPLSHNSSSITEEENIQFSNAAPALQEAVSYTQEIPPQSETRAQINSEIQTESQPEIRSGSQISNYLTTTSTAITSHEARFSAVLTPSLAPSPSRDHVTTNTPVHVANTITQPSATTTTNQKKRPRPAQIGDCTDPMLCYICFHCTVRKGGIRRHLIDYHNIESKDIGEIMSLSEAKRCGIDTTYKGTGRYIHKRVRFDHMASGDTTVPQPTQPDRPLDLNTLGTASQFHPDNSSSVMNEHLRRDSYSAYEYPSTDLQDSTAQAPILWKKRPQYYPTATFHAPQVTWPHNANNGHEAQMMGEAAHQQHVNQAEQSHELPPDHNHPAPTN